MRIGVILISIGTLFLALFLSTGFSYASEIDDLRATIDQKNAELAKIEAEILSYSKQIEQTGKEADSLKKVLKQLEINKKKLLAEIRATQGKINITNTTIQKLNVEIGDKEKRLGQSLAAAEGSIRNVNYLENSTAVEIFLSNENFSDVWTDIDNISSFENKLRGHIAEIKQLKLNLESSKVQKENEKKKLISLKTGLSDQEKIVQNNQKEKDRLLKETKNREANYQKILANRLAKKIELEREILEFEGKLDIAVDPTKLPRVGTGVLSFPLDKIFVTQYFGRTPFATKNPQVYNGMGHNGVDFRASIGTPVKSAANGRVVGTGNTDTSCYGVSYGKWILVEHPNGLSTLYAHLDLVKAGTGDAVSSGETIGYSGNTGYSTGPHLHFTVYATQAVHISSPTEYRSKICGTYMKLPVAPLGGYLNPLSYL